MSKSDIKKVIVLGSGALKIGQWEGLPPMFRSSSEKRTGREEILDFIGKCLTEC